MTAGARGPTAPPGPLPVERARGEHPTDEAWRADALARSRHARLLDRLIEPLEDRDPDRSARICGAVCRAVLADFAPALILLPPSARTRLQALTAWTATLFDFAAQSGLEGERLAQINRWEYELDRALGGEPAGQPVFLALAAEQAARPWPPGGFAAFSHVARRRVALPLPATVHEAARTARRLAGAALASLAPEAAGEEDLVEIGAALLRLRRLTELGHGLRRAQAGLAREELPEDWEIGRPVSRRELAVAALREAGRLRPVFTLASGAVGRLQAPLRPAARYGVLAGRRLLGKV